MFVNLCHFEVRVGDLILPAAAGQPLYFPPILGQADGSAFQTLLGYGAPAGTNLPPPGTKVIVPRMAAAVAYARAAGLVPYTVPQKHLGDRGRPPEGFVALADESELEPAPGNLSFDFPAAPILAEPGRIQRMVGGTFTMHATAGGSFPPPVVGAVDHPDGTATLPPLEAGVDAVIVNQSGPSIRAAQALGVTVLVTSVVKNGKVDLYVVA